AADRRGRRDEALGGVGVLGHDELEDVLVAGAFDHVQRRAEAGPILRDTIDVEQGDLRDALLEHADPRFDEPLALLGRVVFGVLAQIAELARALDLFGQLEFELVVQRLYLVLEFPDQSILHRLHHGPGNRTTVLSFPEWPSRAATIRSSRVFVMQRTAAAQSSSSTARSRAASRSSSSQSTCRIPATSARSFVRPKRQARRASSLRARRRIRSAGRRCADRWEARSGCRWLRKWTPTPSSRKRGG